MDISTYRKHGFTIVELLIVIVVIAILAAISVVAYNGIQQRARDSQRKSDLAAIAKALEVRAIDYDTVLRHSDVCNDSGATGGTSGWFSLTNSSYGSNSAADCLRQEANISQVFTDPSGARNCGTGSPATCFAYLYCHSGNTTYVFAHLESEPYSDSSINGAGCSTGWDTSYGMNYFVSASAY